jgi:hypothetical protein
MKVTDIFEGKLTKQSSIVYKTGNNDHKEGSVSQRVQMYKQRQQFMSQEDKDKVETDKAEQQKKQDKENVKFSEWQKEHNKKKKPTQKELEFKHLAAVSQPSTTKNK